MLGKIVQLKVGHGNINQGKANTNSYNSFPLALEVVSLAIPIKYVLTPLMAYACIPCFVKILLLSERAGRSASASWFHFLLQELPKAKTLVA